MIWANDMNLPRVHDITTTNQNTTNYVYVLLDLLYLGTSDLEKIVFFSRLSEPNSIRITSDTKLDGNCPYVNRLVIAYR